MLRKHLALMALLFLCTPLFAHEDYRVVGTVIARRNSQLQVKTGEGRNISVRLNMETYIHRDKEEESLPATELTPGTTVVVDGQGDDISVLDAVEIRIVPPIEPPSRP